MIAQNRAKRKEHCNLRTGALSKNAMTFTTHSRTTRTSHASSANWIYQLAATSRRVANLPYLSLGPLFKGRNTALVELRQRLSAGEGRAVGLTARQAIHGLGGVGKTRLAVEYAWRHVSDYKDALLFVSARSPVDLRANLAELCSPTVLNLPEWNQLEEIVRVAAVFRWLSEHSGWLLILDNVDTPEAAAEVEKTLPQFQGGSVIITSRIADWITAVQPVELDVLAEEDAIAFLLERTESRRKKILTDSEDAAVVAHDLGGLALALEQGGAYIAKIRVSFFEYRRRWESRKEEVLAWHDERLMQCPKSVATTWQTTIEELSQSERKLLNILAWFAPEPIPLSLLDGNIVDGTDARDALAGLASWSLARWMVDGEGFTVHRLVQEITRQRLPDNEKNDALNAAFDLLNARLPSPDWDETGWQLWERLAPHCRVLLDHLCGHVLEPKGTGMMNNFASWLTKRAEHDEAEPHLLKALAIREKFLGPEHPDVAASLNGLALLYHSQGEYAKAEPFQQRALAILEKALGPEHPDMARSLNNLAGLYVHQGQYAKAETLYQRALAIREKELGLEHSDVAASLNDLALLYDNQGRYAEIKPLYERALWIREKVLGPEHPDVAASFNNLAILYYKQGQLGKAEPLYKQALAIYEKALGPEHPLVAKGLNNLALLYYKQGRYVEAEPLYQRALATRQETLGWNHPDVAYSLNSLAALYDDQFRYAKAEALYKRALEIREKSLSPEHRLVGESVNNLAVLYHEQGRYAHAEPLYLRALEIFEKALGTEHSYVAESLSNLAELLSATNRLAEAERLYQRSLAIWEKALGPEHPDLATFLENYAGGATKFRPPRGSSAT